MELPGITPIHVGVSGVIARVCHDLGIAKTINATLEWDEKQWAVTPGTLITALVVNMLVERKPLYRMEHFCQRMDVPVLFNELVTFIRSNPDHELLHITHGHSKDFRLDLSFTSPSKCCLRKKAS